MPTDRKTTKTLGRSRIIKLFGNIDNDSTGIIIKRLIKLDKKSAKDILIIIDSEGGDVDSLVSIIQTIRLLRCKVATISLSTASSAAAVLLALGEPGKRFVMSDSIIMLHDIGSSLKEDYHAVLVHEMESIRLSKEILINLLINSGVKTAVTLLKPEPTYMLGTTAVKYGIADKVINSLDELLKHCNI